MSDRLTDGLISSDYYSAGNGNGNGNGKCEFIQRNCHEVSNALSMLVAREKPGIACNADAL